MLSSANGPNPYGDLIRPQVWPRLPDWLRRTIPAPGSSLVEDPVNRLLAAVAVGSALFYAALGWLPGPSRLRSGLRAGCLASAVAALVLVPSALDMALASWHGRAWHGHDGGVLQTDRATDVLLQGRNPYREEYLDTPQARQSDRFWRRFGGNPALYHLPYLPGCFVLSIPLRPLARALFGMYDPRMLYLLCYLGTIACAWAVCGPHRVTLAAGVALCPLLVPFVVEGRNEALVLLPMAGMAVSLQRGRVRTALFLWGLACTLKQFAWIYAPFLGCWLLGGAWPDGWRGLTRKLRPLIWAALPVALLIGPFMAWDWAAFREDTIDFMAGASAHPYPFSGTPGLGFANLLLYSGVVQDLREPYGLGGWQLLLAGPLALTVAWSLLRWPDWRVLLSGGTLVCATVLFASRVFHVNYLGLILPMLAFAAAGTANGPEFKRSQR